MNFPTCINPGGGSKKEADMINDALCMSSAWYEMYIERHSHQHKCFTPEVTSRLAIARYEWLLSTARLSAVNSFSDEELYTIALSLQHELAVPKDYPLARSVAEDNFVLWQAYRESAYCVLIDKLLALSPLEDMALRDVVESFWHGLPAQEERFQDYIKKERLRLAEAAPGMD